MEAVGKPAAFLFAEARSPVPKVSPLRDFPRGALGAISAALK
jgi:hypothetical protein